MIRKNDEVFGLLRHLAQDKDGDAQQATQYAQDAVLCLADEDEDSDMSETLVQESPIEDVKRGQRGLRRFSTLAKNVRLAIRPRRARQRATF